MQKRGAALQLELEPAFEDARGMMDPIQIEQVLVNLIRNGIEAQPRGAKLRVQGRVANGHAVIRISDDGPGISASDRAHIFEPFFTTRLSQGGTGLGLAIAHGIVVDHGGTISLEWWVGYLE